MTGPAGCVVAVTYRCNARCEVCDIWRLTPDPEEELKAIDYEWLPKSLRTVNVSGGEPFVRDDLVDVVEVIRRTCPRARIVISTNGLAPARIESMVSKMGDVAVRISVDAVGALHDRIRGVERAYARAIDTLERLAALGLRDLGLAATSSESAAGQIPRVKALADSYGVDFTSAAAHSSPIYFGSHDDERPGSARAVEEFAEIMREQLRSSKPRDWARAYYTRGLMDYCMGRPRRFRCGAGTDFFFLDPSGFVYPCNILDLRMGHIKDGSFAALRRRSAERLREAVGKCTGQCWMVCTVAPGMRKRPLAPLAWMVGAKLLGLDTKVGR